jgi:hypothetical protein
VFLNKLKINLKTQEWHPKHYLALLSTQISRKGVIIKECLPEKRLHEEVKMSINPEDGG